MRVQKSSRGPAATVEGEGTGELLVTIEDFCEGVGEAFAVGDGFGDGVGAGVGVALVIALVDKFAFPVLDLAFVLFDDALPDELSRTDEFLFPGVAAVPRLFAFAFRAESTLFGRVKSRGRFEATLFDGTRSRGRRGGSHHCCFHRYGSVFGCPSFASCCCCRGFRLRNCFHAAG